MYTEYKEEHYNIKNKELETICTWFFAARDNCIIIERHDEQNTGKKVFRVEENNEYVFKLLKTKILARGGAVGLCDFMRDIYGRGARSWTETILNYCYYNMREAKTK